MGLLDPATDSRTGPQPFVFVLMPFDPAFDDAYRLGIKPACEAAGAYCERVDEQVFQESMLDRIRNQIAKADLLVADVTGRNPNVFYEVGYAHALGRRVVLVTREASDIPFDLAHHQHIVYGGRVHELKTRLTDQVRHYLRNPTIPIRIGLDSLRCYLEGQDLATDCAVPLSTGSFGELSLKFGITNLATRTLEGFDAEVFLHVPTWLGSGYFGQSVPIGGGAPASVICLGPLGRVPPGGWRAYDLKFYDVAIPTGPNLRQPSRVQLLSDHESRDVPFNFDAR